MLIDESAYINQIKVIEINVPFKIPFKISDGISYTRKSVILEIKSNNIIGYGEAAPFEAPYYSSETISSVKAMLIEWLIPKINNRNISSIEEFNCLINNGIRGNNFAKAGLETAYWDLISKKNNISLKKLIKIKLNELNVKSNYLENKNYVNIGVSVGIPENSNADTLKKWINNFLEKGYKRIKIKIKPGWDLEPLKVTREIIGPDFPLWVDANSSYKIENNLEILKKIDGYNCLFLEQPLSCYDILGHKKLKNQITTPICLDETLKTTTIGKQVFKLGVSNIWNIKVQRLGGLLEAIKIYSFASKNNISVWGGTMPESGIGAKFILALASFSGFRFSSDVNPSERWFGPNNDLIDIKMNKNSRIYLEDAPGIGEINHKNYNKYGKLIFKT